jgi:hypothetical protein
MSMAQQKNELRNLFKGIGEAWELQRRTGCTKIKNLTDNVWIRQWWNIFNNESSGGSNDTFGRYLAQCTLLCATILCRWCKILKKENYARSTS